MAENNAVMNVAKRSMKYAKMNWCPRSQHSNMQSYPSLSHRETKITKKIKSLLLLPINQRIEEEILFEVMRPEIFRTVIVFLVVPDSNLGCHVIQSLQS